MTNVDTANAARETAATALCKREDLMPGLNYSSFQIKGDVCRSAIWFKKNAVIEGAFCRALIAIIRL